MKNFEDLHTFVICTYKTSPYLEACIQSIKNQTVKSNVIISTSTLTDEVSALAKKYEIEVYEHNKGGGIGKDWNAGLEKVTTKYVTITHQDDIYLPDFAEESIRELEKYDDAILSFTNYKEIGEHNEIKKRNMNLIIKDFMLLPFSFMKNSNFVRRSVMSFGYPICSPTATYNTVILKKFKFSLIISCAIDWELFTRLNKAKGTWIYISRDLVHHRIHTDSATTNLIENNTRTQEELYMFRKYWPDFLAKKIAKVYLNTQKTNNL